VEYSREFRLDGGASDIVSVAFCREKNQQSSRKGQRARKLGILSFGAVGRLGRRGSRARRAFGAFFRQAEFTAENGADLGREAILGIKEAVPNFAINVGEGFQSDRFSSFFRDFAHVSVPEQAGHNLVTSSMVIFIDDHAHIGIDEQAFAADEFVVRGPKSRGNRVTKRTVTSATAK